MKMRLKFCIIFSLLSAGVTASLAASAANRSAVAVGATQLEGTHAPHHHFAEYENYVRRTLDHASASMAKVWDLQRQIFLEFHRKEPGKLDPQHLSATKQEAERNYHDLVYDLAANLSVVPIGELKDPLLSRRVQRLAKLQIYGLRKDDYEQAQTLLRTMQSFVSSGRVCPNKNARDCSSQLLAMVPDIQKRILTPPHLDRLEYFWYAWRREINRYEEAKSSFIEYVRLLRLAAAYNGHVTPSRTWYLYYETENFQRELEDVILEIMPLYKELHAYLRYWARANYSGLLTPPDGGIPAPVMEQLHAMAWSPNTVFQPPYPNSKLPSVVTRLGSVLDSPVKINQKAAEFFESLGFEQLSANLTDLYVRRNAHATPDECKPEVFYFPPEVAMRYCRVVDYRTMIRIHGSMTQLQYNLRRKALQFGVDQEPCPGFSGGMAEAVVIASGTPRHLHRLNITESDTLTAEQTMNRLLRMGIHSLLALPQYFINDRFLVDAMDGRIANTEYNCAYWRLQHKYAGVVPPQQRSERNFDPDFKFYRGLNPEQSNTMKLVSEVLGYEFYRSFCLLSGQYRPGDPAYPLHNCDFYGSAPVGAALRKMMDAGSTKKWRDVMEFATGERKLSGRAVLEYFAPLHDWLRQKNKALGIEPYWDSALKCRSD